jgi:protein-tyrosine phosphatase
MPRPRNDCLAEEVVDWRAAGIELVVSLLEPWEMAELGLGSEAEQCAAQGIAFLAFPIPDRGVPKSRLDTVKVVEEVAAFVQQGRAAAIHCRAGIGRSSLMAACVLAVLGHDVDAAFDMIARARSTPVPDTDEQREWVVSFAGRYQPW